MRHPALRRPARPGGEDHADLRQLHRRRLAQRERARPLHRPRAADPVRALRSSSCMANGELRRSQPGEELRGVLRRGRRLRRARRDRRGRARPGREHAGRARGEEAEGRATTRSTSASTCATPPAWCSTTPTSTRRTTTRRARSPGPRPSKPVTTPWRLQPHRRSYPLENYFLWAVSETPFGKWRREYLIDPILYLFPKVHWRNYEAGYDVAELEPPTRKHRTYVLQEYFVPVERFDGLRAEDGRDPAAPPGQRAQRLGPPRLRRSRLAARLGARRDLRLRPLLQAAHARERARARGGVDARADRRGARGRRHLLPALPAARHARAVPPRLPAREGAVRAEEEARPGVPAAQHAVGQVLRPSLRPRRSPRATPSST